MKLEIYEPEKVEKEKPVKLRLVKHGTEIQLEVVDEDGDEIATLLGITSDGVIELWNGVNSNLGFELDNNNRIKTENL